MKSILSLAIALITLISVNTALAQSPHFIKGPEVTDNGTTITVCGSIAGLGNNELVTITVSSPATIITECTNPGGNVAPGQTKTTTISASGQFSSDKNGRVNFCLTTQTPPAGKCPNGKWTGNVTDVEFGSVTTLVNGKTIRGQ